MHHKICHHNLTVKFFYADCDYAMTGVLSSFPRSHIKLWFCLFSAPRISRNTSDKMLKHFASRHTIYTELVIIFSYFPRHIFFTDLV